MSAVSKFLKDKKPSLEHYREAVELAHLDKELDLQYYDAVGQKFIMKVAMNHTQSSIYSMIEPFSHPVDWGKKCVREISAATLKQFLIANARPPEEPHPPTVIDKKELRTKNRNLIRRLLGKTELEDSISLERIHAPLLDADYTFCVLGDLDESRAPELLTLLKRDPNPTRIEGKENIQPCTFYHIAPEQVDEVIAVLQSMVEKPQNQTETPSPVVEDVIYVTDFMKMLLPNKKWGNKDEMDYKASAKNCQIALQTIANHQLVSDPRFGIIMNLIYGDGNTSHRPVNNDHMKSARNTDVATFNCILPKELYNHLVSTNNKERKVALDMRHEGPKLAQEIEQYVNNFPAGMRDVLAKQIEINLTRRIVDKGI